MKDMSKLLFVLLFLAICFSSGCNQAKHNKIIEKTKKEIQGEIDFQFVEGRPKILRDYYLPRWRDAMSYMENNPDIYHHCYLIIAGLDVSALDGNKLAAGKEKYPSLCLRWIYYPIGAELGLYFTFDGKRVAEYPKLFKYVREDWSKSEVQNTLTAAIRYTFINVLPEEIYGDKPIDSYYKTVRISKDFLKDGLEVGLILENGTCTPTVPVQFNETAAKYFQLVQSGKIRE